MFLKNSLYRNFIFISLLSFFSDRITKEWIIRYIPFQETISIFPFFNLTYVKNTGIAFSLGQNFNLLFIWTTIIMILILTLYAFTQKTNWPIALILGGAAGNLYDRIFSGAVTDFLDFYVGTHHWPAFNIADSFVCIGSALLIYFEYKKSSH